MLEIHKKVYGKSYPNIHNIHNVLVRLEEGGSQCAGEIGGRGHPMCW